MAQAFEAPSYTAELLVAGIKAKAVMAETGEASATATCPKCGGDLRFWLAGPKAHLRGKCFGKSCEVEFME